MTRVENRPCNLSSFIFAEGITCSLHCPTYGTHHGRSVGMRQHSHFRCSLEFGQKLCSFCSSKFVTDFIQAPRSFLQKIVCLEDAAIQVAGGLPRENL